MINYKKVSISFIIVCITAPTLGVILGGIFTSLLGGYETKNSMLVSGLGALLASVCAIPCVFAKEGNLLSFVLPLWFILVFGGMILPCMTGTLLI